MHKEQHRIITKFIELTNALQRMHEQILCDSQFPIWIQQSEHSPAPKQREFAMQKIKQLTYEDKQDKRKAIICPGFMACSQKTYQCIQHVNDAKNEFKTNMLELRKKIKLFDITPQIIFEKPQNIRHRETAQLLQQTGLSRLHLKQCYRNLVLLPKKPKKISWTWANTKAINKISIKKAQKLLDKKGQDLGIVLQQKKLSTLPSSESLAIIQELAPNLRVNIVYNDNANTRQMFKGHMPIFYLDEDNEKSKPNFIKPKEKSTTPDHRIKRSDKKISTDVFLPAIRAYRYIN